MLQGLSKGMVYPLELEPTRGVRMFVYVRVCDYMLQHAATPAAVLLRVAAFTTKGSRFVSLSLLCTILSTTLKNIDPGDDMGDDMDIFCQE